MTSLSRFRSWFRAIVRRSRMESEMEAELRFHIEAYAEDLIRSGVPRAEAMRRARLEFGGIERAKEECRDQRGVSHFETLVQDLRYGLRMLRKSPGFTAVAVGTLALGIGANTAIFSMVNSVLLRPLAYYEPQHLYVIREIIPQISKFYPSLAANLPDFRIWQKECRSFDSIGIAEPVSMDLTGAGESEEIEGVRSSANLFDVLGVRPVVGRGFLPEEDEGGHGHVVVLTDRFWRRRFDGDLSIVGKSIVLDGTPSEVVGILAAGFHFPKQIGLMTEFPDHPNFFQPLSKSRSNEQSLMGDFDFAAIGRLKPGVTREAALAELNVVQAQIAKQANQGMDLLAEIAPLEAEVVGPARRGLLFLLAAVGAVLLIVCVNLANLLLARVPGRMHEAAIRAALGATRRQLVRQLLMESMLLGLLGGTLGIWMASLGLGWLLHTAPASLPRLDEVHIDARILSFAVFISVLTSVIFGGLPAWRIAHADPQGTLKLGAAARTENSHTRGLRGWLIGLEVTLSTVLLILAGLLTTSLLHLLRVNTGFAVERVLAADIDLPPHGYSKPDARLRFYDQAVTNLRAVPGVVSAGWVSILPLKGEGGVTDVSVPGEPSRTGETPIANYRVAGPGYFQTIGIPLIAGRDFVETDRTKHVIIVSQGIAERFWPNQNPIGQICINSWGGEERNEVIGVVGDIRTVRLDKVPVLMVYTPNMFARAIPYGPQSASIVLHTTTDPAASAAAVRDVLRKLDPDVPVVALRPMTALVSQSVETRRFQMSLALIFGFCALLLASLGIFGVVAYSVEQRRHELGIRMALGAQHANVLGMVLRQGMSPVLVGLAAGIIAALFSGRLIATLLFGVGSFDPLTVACVMVVIVTVALAACWIPARRAIHVDPMVALRYE